MTKPASKNGCHDRPPFKQSVTLYDHHGRVVSTWPQRFSLGCQYTHTALGQADERCQGCKHRVTITKGTA